MDESGTHVSGCGRLAFFLGFGSLNFSFVIVVTPATIGALIRRDLFIRDLCLRVRWALNKIQRKYSNKTIRRRSKGIVELEMDGVRTYGLEPLAGSFIELPFFTVVIYEKILLVHS